MNIRILFLGPARDLTGVATDTVALPDVCTVADVQQLLAERFPRLADVQASLRIAVNESFVDESTKLSEEDEIAVIPPVSGGTVSEAVFVDLVTDPIDVERVRSFVLGDPQCGGIATFEGATRAEHDPDHGELICLRYEAYESMAVRQMRLLAEQSMQRFGVERVALVHRLGDVPLAETSVMIAVAGGHRREAFAACQWLIDTLKKDVPIWKRDVFADGFVRWVEPPAER